MQDIDVTGKVREFVQTTEFENRVKNIQSKNPSYGKSTDYNSQDFENAVKRVSSSNGKSFTESCIRDFSRTTEFKNIIKNISGEESFSEYFFKQLQLSAKVSHEIDSVLPNKIDNKLDQVLARKISDKLELELSRGLTNYLRDKGEIMTTPYAQKAVDSYIKNELPKAVVSELNNQFAAFMNTNPQAGYILQQHLDALNNSLRVSATNILNLLVNDPAYTEIQRAHLAQMDMNYNDQMVRILGQSNDQMANQQFLFQQNLHNQAADFERKFNDISSTFRGDMSKVEELKKQVDILNKTLEDTRQIMNGTFNLLNKKDQEHKQEITTLKWFVGGLFGLVVTGLYLFSTVNTHIVVDAPKFRVI